MQNLQCLSERTLVTQWFIICLRFGSSLFSWLCGFLWQICGRGKGTKITHLVVIKQHHLVYVASEKRDQVKITLYIYCCFSSANVNKWCDRHYLPSTCVVCGAFTFSELIKYFFWLDVTAVYEVLYYAVLLGPIQQHIVK